jgi:hypothetical protein
MYLYIYIYAHAYLYMYIYTVYTSIYVLSVYYVHFQHTPYFLDFPENCVTDISWFKENLFCLLSNANKYSDLNSKVVLQVRRINL